MPRRFAAGMGLVGIVTVLIVLVANATAPAVQVVRSIADVSEPGYVPAGAPLGMIGTDPGDPNDPWSAEAPPGGVIVQSPGPLASPGTSGTLRVPIPKNVPTGPRRVGIQAGHWKTDEAPPELRWLIPQTGAAWEGITETEINLDIAQRVAVILNAKGIAVDVLPTIVPPGYIADAFISLHADSDGVGERSGYKLAHSARRGPYEDRLLDDVKAAYGEATSLDYDAAHVSRNMIGYFAHSWTRYQHAVHPYTPAVILEMGYVSCDRDRALMLDEADRVASGIANGIVKFLNETPRAQIFGKELVVPGFPSRAVPSPRP